MSRPDPIEAAIARLPRSARPPRTVSGPSGWAGRAAWGVLVIGAAAALVAAVNVDPYDDAAMIGPAIIFGVAGVASGALLALGRDGQGRPERPWGAAAILLVIWVLLAFAGASGGDAGDEVSAWFLPTLAALLVLEGPLLAGYFVTRAITRARARATLDGASPSVPEPTVLLAATSRWSAPSVLRTYDLSDAGRREFEEEANVLLSHGYRCVEMAERRVNAAAAIGGIAVALAGFGSPDQPTDLRALFVRADIDAVPIVPGTPMAMQAGEPPTAGATQIPKALASIFFFLLPPVGGWAVLFALSTFFTGLLPSLGATALPAFLAGALATRRGHIVAFAIGGVATYGFVVWFGMALGSQLTTNDVALLLAVPAMLFGGHRVRRARGDPRALLVAAGGSALVCALLAATPMLPAVLAGRAHPGWPAVGSSYVLGYDFALPPEFGSYLVDNETETYTFYGGDAYGDVVVRGETLDRETSAEDYARHVDRRDILDWGAPDDAATVIIDGVEWVVRVHDRTADLTAAHDESATSVGEPVPAAVADAVATSGLHAAHVGVRVPATEGTADARAFLLEVLETVTFDATP